MAISLVSTTNDQIVKAFAAADLGWWELDIISNAVTWSARCNELFGIHTDRPITYADWSSAVHPADLKEVESALYHTIIGGGRYDEEYRTIGIGDGKLRWVRSIANVEYDSSGKAVRLTGILIETTKSKVAHAITEETDNRLRVLADTMPQLVWITRPDGYHEFYNSRWFAYTGLTYRDTEGAGWNGVLHPDDQERSRIIWEHSLRSGEDYEIEYRIRRYDGVYQWFLGRALPLRDEQGTITRWFGTCTDIHEQKILNQELQESKEQLNQLANAMPQVVWLAAGDGSIIYFNDRVSNLDGAVQRPDGTWDWERFIHPEDRFEVLAAWKRAVLTGCLYEQEFRVLMRDGSCRWHLGRANPHRDSDGIIMHWYGTTTDIHEQKTVAEELRVSYERFRTLAQNSPDLITRHGKDFKYLYASPIIEQLTGIKPDEFIGKSYYELGIPQELCPVFDQALSTVFQTRKPHQMEYMAQTDREVFIYSRLIPEFDETGDLVSVLIISTDVTEQKKAENIIRESEKRLSLVIEATGFGLWDMNLLTGETILSERTRALYELAPGEPFSFEKYFTKVHPDDRERLMEQNRAIFLHDAIEPRYDETFRLIAGNGEITWLRSIGQLIRNPAGEPVRLIGMIMDISEEKEADRIIQQKEQHFRTLANSIPQLAWMAHADGSVYWYNERWTEYTGTTIEGAAGWGWTGVMHPDYKDGVIEFVQTAWTTEEPFELTIPIRRKDGAFRWFLTKVYPVKDAEGTVAQWIGANTDITERKEVEELLEQRVTERTQELELRNRELEHFAYASHHDLKEPIRKISIFTDMVRKGSGSQLSSESNELLARVSAAAKRMSDALQDVLNYVSLQKQDVREPVDLNLVLQTVKEDLELSLQETAAVIQSDMLPAIVAVPHQMQQLFYNLISNAVKFAKPGEAPAIAITSRKLSPGEVRQYPDLSSGKTYWQVSVTDSGIGFSKKYSEQIFQLFQRLHTKEAYPGTGIGLALCRKVVAGHGGKIRAESDEGSGAVFHIILPEGIEHNAVGSRQ
jgi:PAS domain S-box-containing protein